MSAENPFNPYSSPGSEIAAPLGWPAAQGLDYGRSVKFVWDSPNWIVNVLFAALCSIVGTVIPILPGLVFLGYQCEMLEALLVRPHEPYPDFKVDRIMDYLVRGVWPFVVALLCTLVVIPIMFLVIGVPLLTMGLLMSAAGKDGAGIVVGIMVPLIVVVGIIAGVLCNIAFVPFLLRAALTQDIGAALDFRFAKDFIGRMWKETVLAGLFLIFVAIAAQIIGILLLCIGVLFTIPFVQFAQTHLGMQLYRLYIARGGEKIPLKTVAAVPAA